MHGHHRARHRRANQHLQGVCALPCHLAHDIAFRQYTDDLVIGAQCHHRADLLVIEQLGGLFQRVVRFQGHHHPAFVIQDLLDNHRLGLPSRIARLCRCVPAAG
jgi:hypothetical protein